MRVDAIRTESPSPADRPRTDDAAARRDDDTNKEADGAWKISAALLGAGALAAGAIAFVATRTPARRRLAWTVMKGLAGSALVRSAVVSAGAALARWQLGRLFQPAPEYEVEATLGDVEIRRYPTLVVAETNVVAKSSGAALNLGFERLASYIFGENRPFHPASSDDDHSEKIPMTSPVITQRDGRSWLVRFVMPEGYTLANLPVPRERGIRLRAIAPHRVAAIRSSGTFDSDRIEEMKARLLEEVHEHGLESMGEPMFAGYDAPTTLPFLRRNEAWVELGRGSERHV